MSHSSTEDQQHSLPAVQQPPSHMPAQPAGPATEGGNAADAASNILRDLVLQAAQRAWQARQRAQSEAQHALQARNAFD